MASPILSTAADGSDEKVAFDAFAAATTLEEQTAIVINLLQKKETDYNRANPTLTPLNRIGVQPDYEESQVGYTVDLLLGPNAVQGTIQDSVVPHIPAS